MSSAMLLSERFLGVGELGGVITEDYFLVWMFCKRCYWETPHKIKRVMRGFAWWECNIEGCGMVKSGPHPDRGWVLRQLEQGGR